jgi:hypothetical protein
MCGAGVRRRKTKSTVVSAMLQPVWTVDEIIKALGGPAQAARLTGCLASGVCNWKRPGKHARIPPKYYFILKVALEDKGYYAPLELFGFLGDFRKSA